MWRPAKFLSLALLPLGSATRAAPADIHDIRGPLAPDPFPPFVLTGILLTVLAGMFLLRRRRPTITESLASESRPDLRMALARLVTEYRDGTCLPDRLSIRLDGIVRDALATACGIPAHQLTSIELRQEVAGRLSQGTQKTLLEILSSCDLAKFAGRHLSAAEIDGALAAAERLVDDLAKGEES